MEPAEHKSCSVGHLGKALRFKWHFSGVKFGQSGRVLCYLLCPLSVRDIYNVDVKQVEFTMDVAVNPLNYLKRHVDYCDLPQTILDSSVCNLNEYSAKKSKLLDVVFPDGFGTDE